MKKKTTIDLLVRRIFSTNAIITVNSRLEQKLRVVRSHGEKILVNSKDFQTYFSDLKKSGTLLLNSLSLEELFTLQP